MHALLSPSDLARDQLKIIKMPPAKSYLVLGPAGSGTTEMLIHRASHLSQTNNFAPTALSTKKAPTSFSTHTIQWIGIPGNKKIEITSCRLC